MPGLLAMALGGAALGALANKKDRKKGALMGLGLGLLGPAMGAAGIGSGGVLGTSLGAGGTAATTGAAATGAGAIAPTVTSGAVPLTSSQAASGMTAPIVNLSAKSSVIDANAAKLLAERTAKDAAGDIAGSTLGSQLASGAGKAAVSSAPVALQLLTADNTPAPQRTQSMAMNTAAAAGAPVDLYAQAAMNRQQRMKRGLPGRRLS